LKTKREIGKEHGSWGCPPRKKTSNLSQETKTGGQRQGGPRQEKRSEGAGKKSSKFMLAVTSVKKRCGSRTRRRKEFQKKTPKSGDGGGELEPKKSEK